MTEPNPIHLALGRFIASYSQLLGHLETKLLGVVGLGRPWQIALAQIRSDRDKAEIFFAVCSSVVELNEREKAIRDNLRNALTALRDERNALLHGMWLVAHEPDELGDYGSSSMRWSVKKDELTPTVKRHDPGQLEALADEAERLRPLIWEFGDGCREPGPEWPGVDGRLQLVSGKVIRRDPVVPRE